MGLFENLGRKVEEFKQEATEASKDQADYRCGDCDTLVFGGRDDCPDCGSERLVARDADGTTEGERPASGADRSASGETDDASGGVGEDASGDGATEGREDASEERNGEP